MACYNNIIIPQLIRRYRYHLRHHTLSENEDQHIINTAADDVQETI